MRASDVALRRADDEVRSDEMIAIRIRAEYREMPGLSLTVQQAARLLGAQLSVCQTVLQSLVADGVLYTTACGAYVAAPPTRGDE